MKSSKYSEYFCKDINYFSLFLPLLEIEELKPWCNFGASFLSSKIRKTPSEYIQIGFYILRLWR